MVLIWVLPSTGKCRIFFQAFIIRAGASFLIQGEMLSVARQPHPP